MTEPEPHLPSSELSKQRVVLRHKGKVYHACPKTAHKRGGMSWIWEYGTKLRRTNMKKPDWLCNLCWDKRETLICGTTSETERAFSNTKHTIPPTRSCLGADIVERRNAYTRGIRQASRRAARAAARFYTLIGQKNISQTSITVKSV
jgi:hypothetical protein